jgi:hypothetical protein
MKKSENRLDYLLLLTIVKIVRSSLSSWQKFIIYIKIK